MINFSGAHYPKEAILYAVFFYVRYGVSYRDLEEIMDEEAATRFFKQAIDHNGLPDRVVIDKSGANEAGLMTMNILLFLTGRVYLIEILPIKY